ncbi:MAG: aminodeoxychorismate/anthranilate synthase component II [Rickettsiales bacterium]|jgi:anthranilate synthase/aminodeoxychorismate synthase-like glutamine amidotransferase|nr:aminodeoxychorismate/anthranilate synthase component II [Rickettsiales bacterium]
MILLIDNYDSFTFNIVHYLADINIECDIMLNDQIDKAPIHQGKYKAIFISPGPSNPSKAGQCLEILKEFHNSIPFFGICLGHQAIAEAFGAKIIKNTPMHGKTSNIYHDGKGCFLGLPNPFKATRYHSLIIDKTTLHPDFTISATTEDKSEIMAIRHKKLPLESVQFHPESIASDHGHKILENFLNNLTTLNK